MDFETEKDTEICDITFHCKQVTIQDNKKRITLQLDDQLLNEISNGNFSTVQRLIFVSGKKQYMFSKFREEDIPVTRGNFNEWDKD